MTQREITHNRDLQYNDWHRAPPEGVLPSSCFAYNLDFVEVRKIGHEYKIVAFIEVAKTDIDLLKIDKSYIIRFKYGELKTLQQLTKLTSIPSYIVYHNTGKFTTSFKVFYDLKTFKSVILSNSEYACWLEFITELKPTDF